MVPELIEHPKGPPGREARRDGIVSREQRTLHPTASKRSLCGPIGTTLQFSPIWQASRHQAPKCIAVLSSSDAWVYKLRVEPKPLLDLESGDYIVQDGTARNHTYLATFQDEIPWNRKNMRL
jgi:hypothetical protein